MIYGVGIDIEKIDRMKKALERNEKAFLKYVFTPREISYARKQEDMVSHLTAIFSAKEAVIKTFGTGWKGGVRLTDIEICHDLLGKPDVLLSGNLEKIAKLYNITRIFVSLSYEDTYAIAYATALTI